MKKNKKNEIPHAVIEAAKIHLGDEAVTKYIGKYEGLDVYYSYIPDAEAGFPVVYTTQHGVIMGAFKNWEALEIAGLAVKGR